MVRRRNNFVIVRLPVPERARFPNEPRFLGRYEKKNKVPFLEM